MQAFLPSRSAPPVIISVNAGSIQVPGPFSARNSSYVRLQHLKLMIQLLTSSQNSSKFATLKFFEILAAGNPDIHVVSMHPGVGKSIPLH